MNIVIKKLTPELTKDYIDFMEQVAFTDNEEWAGCYCVFYHWNDAFEKASQLHPEGSICYRRDLSIKFIQEGILQGYLAYVDGKVVGWCNVNDKEAFESLKKEKRPELWDDTEIDAKVRFVVCFTIAPEMRRKGIATLMLQQICEDAKAEGYHYVEAFPGMGEINSRSYHGPYPVFEKCGFQLHKSCGDLAIVRKYLL